MRQPHGPEPISEDTDRIARLIIDAAYENHGSLGPGRLENAYEVCLHHELSKRGLRTKRQVEIPVEYENPDSKWAFVSTFS